MISGTFSQFLPSSCLSHSMAHSASAVHPTESDSMRRTNISEPGAAHNEGRAALSGNLDVMLAALMCELGRSEAFLLSVSRMVSASLFQSVLFGVVWGMYASRLLSRSATACMSFRAFLSLLTSCCCEPGIASLDLLIKSLVCLRPRVPGRRARRSEGLE